jgi:D-glycerate 3-kinase
MRDSGKPGMSDAEIDVFVEYFWKALHPELLIKPLVVEPGWADLVIDIQADHSAGAVYWGGGTNT